MTRKVILINSLILLALVSFWLLCALSFDLI